MAVAGEAGGGTATESQVVVGAGEGADEASPGSAAATADGLDAPADSAAAAASDLGPSCSAVAATST